MTDRVVAELERLGLLLLHDKRLPSVSLLVAGEPVSGSWWSHPAGADIFRASEALDDRDDVVSVKLVLGKVTFVHRPLWPALVGIATSGEPWQKNKLPSAARALWRRVEKEERIEGGAPAAARELEGRLLVASRQVHTDRGHHVRVLESWRSFASRTGTKPLGPGAARGVLEEAARQLGAGAKLPWT
ncbi:MAG TPA: hypothetical protein VFB62_04045 [Polyangiaceae bacterium]|nr:hypothetical protein [Polyangiaceae bacterium]